MRASILLALILASLGTSYAWAAINTVSEDDFKNLDLSNDNNPLRQGLYLNMQIGVSALNSRNNPDTPPEVQRISGSGSATQFGFGFRSHFDWNIGMQFSGIDLGKRNNTERSLFCPCGYIGYTLWKAGNVRWQIGPRMGTASLQLNKASFAQAELYGPLIGLTLTADVLLHQSRTLGFSSSFTIDHLVLDKYRRDSESSNKPSIFGESLVPEKIDVWILSLAFGMMVNLDI